ncbi:hypothetical protein SAMN05445871_2654 [Paraburkholderia caballeronis]|nr:hypothetical protein SAMN05445871_2654 [Paraburkholderia caballeronis]
MTAADPRRPPPATGLRIAGLAQSTHFDRPGNLHA